MTGRADRRERRRDGAAAHVDPTRATFFQLALYRVVRDGLVAFSHVFWRLSVRGREHVPRTGPFILAPVHRSNIDSPLVSAVTRRRMRFMGKEEMWKYRFSSWFFTGMGGVPVARGSADRDALRTCSALLGNGEPVVMFPEGQRREGPVVDDLFDGVAYVSLRTGVPIVPVGIGGSADAMPIGASWIKPVRVALVVGEPIWPVRTEGGPKAPRRAVRELTEQLQDRVQSLFDEAEAHIGRR